MKIVAGTLIAILPVSVDKECHDRFVEDVLQCRFAPVDGGECPEEIKTSLVVIGYLVCQTAHVGSGILSLYYC